MIENPERAFLMLSLYSTGTTMDEIALEFGVSRERVRQLLRKVGADVRPRYRGQADPILVCNAAPRANDIEELATLANTTPGRARSVLVALGKWDACNRRWREQNSSQRMAATRDDILERLRALGKRLGRTPTQREMNAERLWNRIIRDHFGTINEARRRCGFEPPTRGGSGYWRPGKAA